MALAPFDPLHPIVALYIRSADGQGLQSVSNANHLALAAGLASLEDPDFLGYSENTNATAKQILYSVLGDLDLSHLPSHTNFLMHRINADLTG